VYSYVKGTDAIGERFPANAAKAKAQPTTGSHPTDLHRASRNSSAERGGRGVPSCCKCVQATAGSAERCRRRSLPFRHLLAGGRGRLRSGFTTKRFWC